jgi:hypothetical protein
VIVCFADIGEIDDHYWSTILLSKYLELQPAIFEGQSIEGQSIVTFGELVITLIYDVYKYK